ncbi:hypothetical protein Misp06_04371 [Microbulbifer sp. NBRC 101763]|uniref:hypothetical protein n=1 Tax=Microbulbifer sp. NBRC 101763 TaxID=1113820 RepID=UPI00309D0DEC
MICEKGLDGFSKERVRVQRIEFSLLVSEIGAHSIEAMINLNRQKFKVRQLLEDDGVVGGYRGMGSPSWQISREYLITVAEIYRIV